MTMQIWQYLVLHFMLLCKKNTKMSMGLHVYPGGGVGICQKFG